MIKKELGVFRRVPGSSDQYTDLDITLVKTGRYFSNQPYGHLDRLF